jgi:PPOX class probable F420-dependent enzyme
VDSAAEWPTRSRYLSLGTYRRSGAVVDTPLWFADFGGALVAFTQRESGKVKRLRRTARARVAPCDVRGRLRGDWQEARAQVVSDPARAERAIAALRARYGWQFRLLEGFARLSGRRSGWAVIEIVPVAGAPAGT